LNTPEELLAGLADPRGLTYHADPRGPLPARRAIADDYRRWNAAVDPDSMVLAASTSEAYSLLFKLLCDPGDTVLVPRPSYPLFEQLTRLDAVTALPFELRADDDWRLPTETLAAAPGRTRAVILVHPNNPTGHHVHPEDAAAVTALCRQRRWALIVDEVFLPFTLDGGPGAEHSFAGEDRCLSFTLGGLSKSIGLPQLKLAWIIPGGPAATVAAAGERLDYITDAYLSVSTPAALAVPELLRRADGVQRAITERCDSNLQALRRAAASLASATVLPVGGGWSAILRLPALMDDEELALQLLEERGVAVQPGFFYDLPFDASLVLSLLTPNDDWRRGLAAIVETVTGLV
jgi:aspartate/methionine/tyrosine aminotransferase